MEYIKTIGKSQFNITIDAAGDRADMENEGQGSSIFSFYASDLLRIIPEGFEIVQTNQDDAIEYRTSILKRLAEDGGGLDDCEWESEGQIATTDVDAALIFLGLCVELKESIEFDWQSQGSAFWLFHDLHHVENDVIIDADYPTQNGIGQGEISVTRHEGHREEHATLYGAIDAIRSGVVPIAEVVTEMTDNAKPFEERFGYAPTFLDDLLSQCTLTFTETQSN